MLMEEKAHRLLQPLLPSSPTTTGNLISATSVSRSTITPNSQLVILSSNSEIIFRYSVIIFIGIVSIWANHQASIGHSITIINEAGATTPAGRRFNLFYASNGKASRLVYDTSKFVENFLYPNASYYPKKRVDHVRLVLSNRNMTQTVAVHSSNSSTEHVIHLNPKVLEETDHGHAMLLAVQQGMARVWLWDGPSSLVNGIVVYISHLADGADWVQLLGNMEGLNDCERKGPGSIGRLNQELGKGWDDHQTMDDGDDLGILIQKLCGVNHSSSTFRGYS